MAARALDMKSINEAQRLAFASIGRNKFSSKIKVAFYCASAKNKALFKIINLNSSLIVFTKCL